MERNTATTAYELQTGDRFYKLNDKKKIVYRKNNARDYMLAAIADNVSLQDNAKELWVKKIKADTQVIFLRHAD